MLSRQVAGAHGTAVKRTHPRRPLGMAGTGRHGRDREAAERIGAEESCQTGEMCSASPVRAQCFPHHASKSAAAAALNFGPAFDIEHVGRGFQRRIQRGTGIAERQGGSGIQEQGMLRNRQHPTPLEKKKEKKNRTMPSLQSHSQTKEKQAWNRICCSADSS